MPITQPVSTTRFRVSMLIDVEAEDLEQARAMSRVLKQSLQRKKHPSLPHVRVDYADVVEVKGV